MITITDEILLALGAAALTLFVVQCALSFATFLALRGASRERAEANKELFGLVRRIEALTANRREQMLQHYDGLLQSLSLRLPALVASHASQQIFETESRILSRLAELEPNLKNDEPSRRKMDELIRTMEGLETTIIHLTTDAVEKIMVEGRRELLEESSFFERQQRAA